VPPASHQPLGLQGLEVHDPEPFKLEEAQALKQQLLVPVELLHHFVVPDRWEQSQVLYYDSVDPFDDSIEAAVGECCEGYEAGGCSYSRGWPWRG